MPRPPSGPGISAGAGTPGETTFSNGLPSPGCNENETRDTNGMSMEHQNAMASKASERYLLGEMSEPERFDFEAHYFDCALCAEDVRTGAALARGIKAVCAEDATLRPQTAVVSESSRNGWFSWLRFPMLAPSAMALAFGCVAAWQTFVVIPGLRWAGSPQALSPVVLRAAARGEEQAITVKDPKGVSALSLDVNTAAPGGKLRYEVDGPGGGTRASGTAYAPPQASPLILVIPNAAIRESGEWVLILRDPEGAELARYPFSIRTN